MKKLLIAFFLSTCAFAASNVQQSIYQLGNTNTWVLAYNWTADTGGNVTPTLGQLATCCQGYNVSVVEIVPGTPSPTAGYAVAIQDGAGVDVLGGAAVALSATAAQSYSASPAATPIQGALKLVITGQSVNSAKGIVYVFLSKPGQINALNIGRNPSVATGYVLDANSLLNGGAAYPALSAACTAANASGATLVVSLRWNLLLSQTLSCPLFFLAGGIIQPASGQTISLSQCPAIAGLFRIVDFSQGGHVAPPANCALPVQAWGSLGDDSTDNGPALNEMAAYVSQIIVPAGTYRSSQTWTSPIVGQTIKGNSPSTSILKFTGATQGIDMFNASVAQKGNIFRDFQLQFTNAAANSALILDCNAHPCSQITVENIDVEAPSGNLINGIRVLGCQSCWIGNNRFHGNIDHGVILGDGSTQVTFTTLSHNEYGSINPTATGLTLNNAQTILSLNEYWQGQMANFVTVDVSSDLHVVGSTCDAAGFAVGSCITSNGNLTVDSMSVIGSAPAYTDGILVSNGSAKLAHVTGNTAASAALVHFRNANPGSYLTASTLTNAHATGQVVEIDFGTNSTASQNTLSAVAGACVALNSGGSNLDLTKNNCTSATGFGVNVLDSNSAYSFSDSGSNYNVTNVAHACGNCDGGLNSTPLNIGSTGRTFNKTTLIPDAESAGASVASAGVIVPTGAYFHITGTSAISIITPPFAGYAGCVDVIPDGAFTLAPGSGPPGGIANASTAIAGKLMRLCYDGLFGDRKWYASY